MNCFFIIIELLYRYLNYFSLTHHIDFLTKCADVLIVSETLKHLQWLTIIDILNLNRHLMYWISHILLSLSITISIFPVNADKTPERIFVGNFGGLSYLPNCFGLWHLKQGSGLVVIVVYSSGTFFYTLTFLDCMQYATLYFLLSILTYQTEAFSWYALTFLSLHREYN